KRYFLGDSSNNGLLNVPLDMSVEPWGGSCPLFGNAVGSAGFVFFGANGFWDAVFDRVDR
ncbi:MAG: hypothetical protein KDA84_29285, partial [Planctomycetaceae bacterium]|nr:hypothetical protein [Planctomycetaceae bacterium]